MIPWWCFSSFERIGEQLSLLQIHTQESKMYIINRHESIKIPFTFCIFMFSEEIAFIYEQIERHNICH